MALNNSELQRLLALLRQAGVSVPVVQGIDTLRKLLTTAVRGRSLSADARQILGILQNIEREARRSPSGRDESRPITAADVGFRPGQPPTRTPGQTASSFGQPPRNQLRTKFPQGYPEEQPSFSDEFMTPTSSNVYSFQYFRRPGDLDGTLFVTFKASALNGNALSRGGARFKGGRKQLHGILGHTVGSKRFNSPGSTYAYHRVGHEVFTAMKRAYSKGEFVWETLRGHTKGTPIDYSAGYKYSLVVGQLLTGEVVGQYVPRKATNSGFVTRSLADTGTGRRSFVSSTLPPSAAGGGFSSRGRRR